MAIARLDAFSAACLFLAAACARPARDGAPALPEESRAAAERAVAYLSEEVPRWLEDNGCRSCHHDGDGASALYEARRHGFPIPDAVLAGSIDWLLHPDRWGRNKGDPRFDDPDLARLQFAAALSSAAAAGIPGSRTALAAAAELVAARQRPDGSWRIEPDSSVGSPVTWGSALATRFALRTLRAAGRAEAAPRIERGLAWLRAFDPATVPDAAAIVLALTDDGARREPASLARARDFLVESQGPRGGWGPYPRSAPEPFDTALALIALAALPPGEDGGGDAERLRRGRDWLLAAQDPGGGWPETTRPAGAQSYAQHTSTSAWALRALLATGAR